MTEVVRLIDASAVALALSSPVRIFVEDGCPSVALRHDLALTVRTDTAFRLPLAAILISVLREHISLSQDIADSIELALHEALANAVVHGNLELTSEARGSVEQYGHFCATLEERLRDPVMARRTICVIARWTKTSLVLSITDEGRDFAPPVPSASVEAPFGRGLALVRLPAAGVRWNQCRGRLVMRFNIGQEAMA